MSLLEVTGVGIHFGGLRALNNVSLDVQEGELYALIGPNGAGKSTLFNIISGMFPPSEGKVVFKGQQIQGLPMHKMAGIGISRTFQNIRLLPDVSVAENIRLGQHVHLKQNMLDSVFKTKRYCDEEAQSFERALECLHFVGIEDLKDELPKNLSYGYQRKVEIARTLATGAELLLFDEPCAGMNSAEKVELSELMKKINKELHKTVFLIEHDMRFVMNISERITVLNHGEVIAHGTPTEIQTSPIVIEAYLGNRRK